MAWILPVGTGRDDARMLSMIRQVKRDDVEAEVSHLRAGLPDNLEYHYYEHLVEDDLLLKIVDYERRGFGAVVIGCFYDGGLREARELVSMPVVGEGQAGMLFAASLGHRFSIISGRRKWVPKFEDNATVYGVSGKLSSIRVVDYSIRRISKDRDGYLKAVEREAKKAIEEDGAEVILLSEEASFTLDKLASLQSRLSAPVIDPGVVAWKWAELAADLYKGLGLSHSKVAEYETPPRD